MLRATAAEAARNWRRAWSLDCIWRTECCHERGVLGLNGEQGLLTWNSSRVEPCTSAALHFGFRARVRVRERESVATVNRRVAICKVILDGVVKEIWLDGYLYIVLQHYYVSIMCVNTLLFLTIIFYGSS